MTAGTAVHAVADTTNAASVVMFLVVVSATLLLCFHFGVNSEGIDDLYVASNSLKPWRNAFALAGDLISILTLLTTTTLVALAGYDGMALAASTVGALAVLLVLARPVRNIGRFTLGDTLDERFGCRSIRVAAAVATLSVAIPLAIVQLTASGRATAALLGLSGTGPAQLCTIFMGTMMVCASALTGMRGNTMLQVVKTVMLFACMGLLFLALMTKMGWSLDRLLADASDRSENPESYFTPGNLHGRDTAGRFDLISMQITVVLGAAVSPHMIMRVKAAEHGASARRSVLYAMTMVGVFCGMIVVLGLGAAAVADGQAGQDFDLQSASALLSLVHSLAADGGGYLLVAMTVSVVFLTSLTVVAALTLSAGAALVHDVWAQGALRGRIAADVELSAMRWVTPVIGTLTVFLSVLAQSWNIQFLPQFVAATAASTILPSLVYALFWKGCTRAGVVWSVYGGLGSCMLLQFFGPQVSGSPRALFPAADFAWFPLSTTGLVSVPVGLAAGWAASRLTSRKRDCGADERYAAVAARAAIDDDRPLTAKG